MSYVYTVTASFISYFLEKSEPLFQRTNLIVRIKVKLMIACLNAMLAIVAHSPKFNNQMIIY